jgi:membrane-bound lytic murein transglycosylase
LFCDIDAVNHTSLANSSTTTSSTDWITPHPPLNLSNNNHSNYIMSPILYTNDNNIGMSPIHRVELHQDVIQYPTPKHPTLKHPTPKHPTPSNLKHPTPNRRDIKQQKLKNMLQQKKKI